GADKVGMAERPGGTGLAVEAFADGRVVGPLGRQDLDGDAAAHYPVLSQVDATHAAAAEAFQDQVVSQAEALVAALEQLLGLETGDQALLDHAPGQTIGTVGGSGVTPDLFPPTIEAPPFHQPALADQIDEGVNTRRSCCHCSFVRGMPSPERTRI